MRMVMIVVVMMAVVMIMMMVMVVLIAEEVRLEIEDAIEIEGIAAQHRIQWNLGTLRLMQLGVRIDAANARLDIAEFVGRDEIGFVDQNHVRESDLTLCFRRVLEPLIEPFGVS